MKTITAAIFALLFVATPTLAKDILPPPKEYDMPIAEEDSGQPHFDWGNWQFTMTKPVVRHHQHRRHARRKRDQSILVVPQWIRIIDDPSLRSTMTALFRRR